MEYRRTQQTEIAIIVLRTIICKNSTTVVVCCTNTNFKTEAILIITESMLVCLRLQIFERKNLDEKFRVNKITCIKSRIKLYFQLITLVKKNTVMVQKIKHRVFVDCRGFEIVET